MDVGVADDGGADRAGCGIDPRSSIAIWQAIRACAPVVAGIVMIGGCAGVDPRFRAIPAMAVGDSSFVRTLET